MRGNNLPGGVMEKIYTNIRLFRTKKKISKKELAEFCGLSYEEIDKIECGVIDLEYSKLKKLAEALDVSFPCLDGYADELFEERFNRLSAQAKDYFLTQLTNAEKHYFKK